jgi:hypothetical protein
MKLPLLALALFAAPVIAAPPVPDPRLEVALSTNVVAQIHRSVELQKTIPLVITRAKPVVNEQDMAKAGDDIFIERALLPPRPRRDDREAVRIYRRDR